MRYEVRVAAHGEAEASRFELERDEPLKEDDPIRQFSMVYRVKRVQPLDPSESDEFDAIVDGRMGRWSGGVRVPGPLTRRPGGAIGGALTLRPRTRILP